MDAQRPTTQGSARAPVRLVRNPNHQVAPEPPAFAPPSYHAPGAQPAVHAYGPDPFARRDPFLPPALLPRREGSAVLTAEGADAPGQWGHVAGMRLIVPAVLD